MNTDVFNMLSILLQLLGVMVTGFSAWLVVRQLKVATQASRFEAMRRVAELMRDIDDSLYNMPTNIIYRAEEFPDNPPPRFERWNPSAGEVEIMAAAREKEQIFLEKREDMNSLIPPF